MASKIASPPATGEPVTHTEAKRPLMSLELLKAAIDGNETYLKKFLGRNNNEPDTEISTAEDVATMEPSVDCLRSIAGMEDTILHILSANGHENIVATICTKDSSLLKAHNARCETPFHHAARFGHDNTIRILTEHAEEKFREAGLKELLRQKNFLGETALHEAARHGHKTVVTALMEKDVELAGLVNNNSVSPLYLATARGSLDVVKELYVNWWRNHEFSQATPDFFSGPKKQTALHAAVLQGPELTEELLRLYPEPLLKGKDETGRTSFHLVASTGNHQIAELILNKNRSLAYLQDSDGLFPVHTAVRMGHVKMIVLLLQLCPDSGQLLDGKGRNFLHIAIEAKKLEIIFKLLKDSENYLSNSYWKKIFNVMLNTTDNKGNTPLHLAAEHGYVTVRHSILENNELDLILQNKEGQIAFDLSAIREHRPIMSSKLLQAAIDGDKDMLEQALAGAFVVGELRIQELFPVKLCNCLFDCLKDAKDVIQRTLWDNYDEEALCIGTGRWWYDCPRSVTGMGDTILHILSAYDHGNTAKIICSGTDILGQSPPGGSWTTLIDSSLLKACNVRGETPFHHAARFGKANTISILISCAESEFGEAGLKELLRQKNCLGETALHEAARHGHKTVVTALMEKDVELAGLVNNDSVSPLYLATARGSLDVVQEMVEKLLNHETTPAFYSGPKKQTALHAAVLQDPGITEEILKMYPERLVLTEELLQLPSERLDKWADETGRTPLHLVASTGNHQIAKLLLEEQPSLAYIQDSEGSFPVHIAARMGHVKIIVLLWQKCLDSGELLDGNGRNFLHISIESFTLNGIHEMLDSTRKKLPIAQWKEMLNRMANTMDNKGNTPLHLAAQLGCIDFLYFLLANNESDPTLQNKEGLTALDIAVISEDNTKNRSKLSESYARKREGRSSTGWLQYYTKYQMSENKSKARFNLVTTTDKEGAKKTPESVMDKAQLVGLGSVLIATVTFAAAFTLPGGTNQDTGYPILGRKYVFKAFVLADLSAFFLSILSTMTLVYSSSDENPDRREGSIALSMSIFTVAARCMFLALALGLYVVLAPISNTGILVIAFSSSLVLTVGNTFSSVLAERSICYRMLLNGIQDGGRSFQAGINLHARVMLLKNFPVITIAYQAAKGLLTWNFKPLKLFVYVLGRFYGPILGPLIFIFVFALI